MAARKLIQPSTIAQFLGQSLQRHRLDFDLTQQQLADMLCRRDVATSQRTVSDLESGRGWTLDTTVQVWRVLGLDPWRLAAEAEANAKIERETLPLLRLAGQK